MQPRVAVSSVPVQTGQVTVSPPPQSLNIPVLRGLAFTQIVFGVFTIIFGIVSIAVIARGYWVNKSGSAIWFGIWILITGIIGICSVNQTQNRLLNGANLGFNVCCTVFSFFVGVIFAIALAFFNNCSSYLLSYGYYGYYYGYYNKNYYYCTNKSTGVAIYSLLTLLMVAEFFVSLIISVYCCKASGSCGNRPSGVIVQQQPGYSVATTGQTFLTTNTGYSQAPYPGSAISYSGAQPMYQPYPQQSQPAMVVQQPGMMVQQPGMMVQQPEMMVQQPGIMVQQPGIMVQQPGMMVQQPEMMVQQPGMMVQQPGMMVQQSGMMVQQPEMIAAQTNTVNSASQQQQQMDCQKTAPPAYSS